VNENGAEARIKARRIPRASIDENSQTRDDRQDVRAKANSIAIPHMSF